MFEMCRKDIVHSFVMLPFGSPDVGRLHHSTVIDVCDLMLKDREEVTEVRFEPSTTSSWAAISLQYLGLPEIRWL